MKNDVHLYAAPLVGKEKHIVLFSGISTIVIPFMIWTFLKGLYLLRNLLLFVYYRRGLAGRQLKVIRKLFAFVNEHSNISEIELDFILQYKIQSTHNHRLFVFLNKDLNG